MVKITDINGKVHDVGVTCYRGVALVAYTMPMTTPISSRIILDDGETLAVMTDEKFRGNSDLHQLILEGERVAILSRVLPVTSGEIYCVSHPNHGANKLFPLMGMDLKIIEINNQQWNRWSIPVLKILSGKL